jgi:hypothetical protein
MQQEKQTKSITQFDTNQIEKNEGKLPWPERREVELHLRARLAESSQYWRS